MKKTARSGFLAFSLLIILSISGCARASTFVPLGPLQANTPPPGSSALPEQISKNGSHTIAEVEELAGFDVQEPSYLPAGVLFDLATYEGTPDPNVTLHFKFVHKEYGDMGPFFQIRQALQMESPPAVSCGETVDGCEILQVGDMTVVYRLYTSPNEEGANTEGLEWHADGFSFRLHRMAGEPNKIYKEELVKVVSSME